MARRRSTPHAGPGGGAAPEESRREAWEDHHGELRPGWSRPKPEHVPRPTYWPAVLAFGVTFMFWGLISTLIISAIGLVIFAIGLAGWIGELRHGD